MTSTGDVFSHHYFGASREVGWIAGAAAGRVASLNTPLMVSELASRMLLSDGTMIC